MGRHHPGDGGDLAFFTDNKPVKGDQKFQFSYEGAIYYFASQEHLGCIPRQPRKYKPQFGGWCAGGFVLGRVAPIDVSTFRLSTAGYLFSTINGSKWLEQGCCGQYCPADGIGPGVAGNGGNRLSPMKRKPLLNNTDPMV